MAWTSLGLGESLRVLELSDFGADSRSQKKTLLRAQDFSVFACYCSVRGVLRVNSCKWWSDAVVVAVLSGAETATGVTRWDVLSMSHTAVTRAAVTSCWSAGVAVVAVP